MIKDFKRFWENYTLQSFLAAFAVLIIFLLLNVDQAVIVASIGATAFIVFAMPRSITAKPRNIIGGHLIGVFCGSLFALIPHSSMWSSVLIYSIAVGFSMFLMVVLDAEHPPASGTALGVAIKGFSLNVVTAVMVSAGILSLIHYFFKPYLRDLV